MSAEPASAAHNRAVPIAQYSMDDLAAIYNRARVDYIVPMPMNGKRMAEYIQPTTLARNIRWWPSDWRISNPTALACWDCAQVAAGSRA